MATRAKIMSRVLKVEHGARTERSQLGLGVDRVPGALEHYFGPLFLKSTVPLR
jgi:hypothetical protein